MWLLFSYRGNEKKTWEKGIFREKQEHQYADKKEKMGVIFVFRAQEVWCNKGFFRLLQAKQTLLQGAAQGHGQGLFFLLA